MAFGLENQDISNLSRILFFRAVVSTGDSGFSFESNQFGHTIIIPLGLLLPCPLHFPRVIRSDDGSLAHNDMLVSGSICINQKKVEQGEGQEK